MASTWNGQTSGEFVYTEQGTSEVVGQNEFIHKHKNSISWGSGSSDDQMEAVFSKEYNTNAAQTLDLTALTDRDGSALAFTAVKQIILINKDTTNPLLFGADANHVRGANGPVNDTTSVIRVPPATANADGRFEWFTSGAGTTVTGGTGDIIKMDPNGNTIQWVVLIVGTTS